MQSPLQKCRGSVGFNMTPMIDVVFLLIIFFLVSSRMAQQEVQMNLDLPQAASGHDQTDQERPRVTVNILPEGEVQLSGESLGSESLVRRLSVERQKTGESLEVRIRADRSVAYRVVEPVLIACTQARIWNVTFAVTRER